MPCDEVHQPAGGIVRVNWCRSASHDFRAFGVEIDAINLVNIEVPFEVRLKQRHAVLVEVDQAPSAPWQAANDDIFATRSEEHTSELQSLMRISYAVFCLKKTQNI